MLILQNLITKGTVPKDCILVTAEKTTTLKEVEANNHQVGEETIIVAENFSWVAYSESLDVYFSANDVNEVCRHDKKNQQCSMQRVKNDRLKTNRNVNLKNREEVMKMANKKDELNLEDINLGDDINLGGEEGTETTKLDAFDNVDGKENEKDDENDAEKEAKKKAKEERKSKLEKLISMDTEGVKLADVTILSEFNRRNGALMGYITTNDSLIKFGTSTVIDKDPITKKPRLSDAATNQAREVVARGGAISALAKTNFVTKTSLTTKQTTPGKVLATILAVPEGGNKPLGEIFNSDRVAPDETKKDLTYLMLDVDETIQVVSHLFDGSINESKATFGDQATRIDVKLKLVDDTNDDGVPEVLKKFSLKPFKRSNKMTENSYFPLKTFKTVSLGGTLTEEECQVMAMSSFRHLYQNALKSTGRKIDVLRPEDKALINSDEEGNFSSKYFTTSISDRLALEIKPAFTSDKDARLQEIHIPIKEVKEAKNGNNPVAKYIAFDCLGKLETTEAKELNSLAQAKAGKKFSVFFEAVGGEATLNEESLRSIKPKRGSKNSQTSTEVDPKTMRELLAASLQGKDGNLKFDKASTASLENLDRKLYSASHEM